MIQFAFNMPLWLMGVYGGAMVLVVLALRLLLGRWLPKRVMPVLWAVLIVLAVFAAAFAASSEGE